MTTRAKATFSLRVESTNPCEVWPPDAHKTHPQIDKQIAESYYYDEDDASALLEITNIDDLLAVIAFYAGRTVKLTLETMVTTPDVETTSYLNWSGSVAYVTAREPDKLSPEMAAQKLMAIANAMTR